MNLKNAVMKNTIRVERAKKGFMTQQDLANAVGMNKVSISNIETGFSIPNLINAYNIANYFGLKVDELFTLEKEGENDV